MKGPGLLDYLAAAYRLLAVLSVIGGAVGIGFGASKLPTSEWLEGLWIILASIVGGGFCAVTCLAAGEIIPRFITLFNYSRISAECAEEARRHSTAERAIAGLKKKLEGLVNQHK